jgi:transcriptional regulator GlxA family with amidase domain
LFRRLTGLSPKNYVTRLRIHRVAQLLGTANHRAKTIAAMLGYEDALYFATFSSHQRYEPIRLRGPDARIRPFADRTAIRRHKSLSR